MNDILKQPFFENTLTHSIVNGMHEPLTVSATRLKLKSALKTYRLEFKQTKDMKSNDISDPQRVTEYIQKLDPEFGKMIEVIRQIILKTDKEIGERIKWNNPSFFYTGEMEPFNPKEYKREIIVFNLFKNKIMLVFPSGAKVNDITGLLEGDYKDGRRITILKDLEDIKSKEKTLQNVIKIWLTLVDR